MPVIVGVRQRGFDTYFGQRLEAEAVRQGYVWQTVSLEDVTCHMDEARARLFIKGEPGPALTEVALVVGCFGNDVMGWEILGWWERLGYPLAQPERTYFSKAEQMMMLAAAGLPVPQTLVFYPGEPVTPAWALQSIVKPIWGGRGRGVEMVKHGDLRAHLAARTEPVLVQEVVAPLGRDVRAFVLNNKVIAAMERMAPPGDFRANMAVGATGKPTALTRQETGIVTAAVQTYGISLAGVDFVRTDHGPVILEVNKGPSVEGLEQVTGENIVGQMLDFYLLHVGVGAPK